MHCADQKSSDNESSNDRADRQHVRTGNNSGYYCQQGPRYCYGRNRKSGAEPVTKNTAGELKNRVACGEGRKHHP